MLSDKHFKEFEASAIGQSSRFASSIEDGLTEMRIAQNRPHRVYIGNHLVAIAYIQNRANNQAALILEFETIRGNSSRCIISKRDFVGRGIKNIFGSLLTRGYHYERKQREAILDYLSELGAELPTIVVKEHDRADLNLHALVFDGGLN
jgi:hypothetical protein